VLMFGVADWVGQQDVSRSHHEPDISEVYVSKGYPLDSTDPKILGLGLPQASEKFSSKLC